MMQQEEIDAFVRASREGDNQAVFSFITRYGNRYIDGMGAGQTALTAAAFHGHLSTVTLLLQLGADVNYRDCLGYTALAWAARADKIDCVKVLLHAGADVNIAGDTGRSPLMLAATEASVDVLKILLENGADIQARDKTEKDVMDLAEEKDCLMAANYIRIWGITQKKIRDRALGIETERAIKEREKKIERLKQIKQTGSVFKRKTPAGFKR